MAGAPWVEFTATGKTEDGRTERVIKALPSFKCSNSGSYAGPGLWPILIHWRLDDEHTAGGVCGD